MLQNAPLEAIKILLNIFNSIWTSQTFPNEWKIAEVIPIRKPNKNPLQLNNYRPISLTSVLCKLLERVINARLQWILETRHLLSDCQCGFRAGRSTTDQMLFLQNSIQEAFTKKFHVLAIFFDFN